jgi:tyrosyl-tRNA synthetase
MQKNYNIIKLIKELEERGILFNRNISKYLNLINLEENEKVLYFGIDSTGDSLHIGHLSPIIQLFRFSKEDFKIIFLIGTSTGKIGDPSDKLKEREILKEENIFSNKLKIINQIN